ncbi:MAG TPA: hypothetical protein VJ377_00475 [Dehalococcoidales bacterium]|nr:MAG: hypothetical protein A2Z05_06020 [Chloroflexi bacterium RBG_16_60_22]HJX11981.1 hypothetical protein [Dehalococcoidales bacterium]
MDLTGMRTIVRRDLHDEDSGSYRWTDNELNRHIDRAVKEFSEHLPYEQKATKATTSGSRELDITTVTNRVMVEAVEYPVDKFPRRYQPFSLWGDVLTLLGDEVPDGSNAYIYYGKLHTLDASGSTVPTRHEDLIAAGAAGFAAVEWAVYAVNRVNVGGTVTPREFLDWGNLKLRFFRGELRRLGRRDRVRVSSLYRPHYPIVSKSTDYGP